MKKSVYSILDEKAQCVGPLFVAVSDDEAERIVRMSLTGDSLMKRCPADFALMRLGDVELSTGLITACSVPVLVCKVDSLVD